MTNKIGLSRLTDTGVYFYLILALVAFAANSVLCRLALASGEIDPSGFTIVRLVSGAVTLVLILLIREKHEGRSAIKLLAKGSWLGAFALFIYALGFSYAYVQLDTGSGALVLFGSVQLSMIAFGLYKGERFNEYQWSGLLLALVGLVYLLWPSISTPSMLGAALMMLAGLAWGVYSILGKSSTDALADTACNFLRSTVFVALLLALSFSQIAFSLHGLALAVASGAFASGVGYAVWYSVLPKLTSMHAAVAQLSVPIIAGLGGVVLVNEALTLHLSLASVMVLGGVLIVIKLKSPVSQSISSEN
ncbi:DMT family transporter [Glaciecola sp. SC05]|uniref:DMT family transporter n=1 Tax=Glaciecola sp. SC05 TaxID=1987355 RepID=UPI003526DB33